MCCMSVALGSRDTHAVGPHPVGMALPSLSIPVPELGRIFSPQGSLPKGSGTPWPWRRGLWEPVPPLLPITALNSNHQNGGETVWGFVKINKFKEKASNVFPQQPRRHMGCLASSPPRLLIIKREKKARQKVKGSWGQSPGNTGDSNVLLAGGRGSSMGRPASPCGWSGGMGTASPVSPGMEVTARWALPCPQGCSAASRPRQPC